MGDRRRIRSDEVEIVIARELRKAGLALSIVRVLSRRALAPEDPSEYAMELTGLTPTSTASGTTRRDVLIDFRNEARVTDVDAVRALDARAAPVAPTRGSRWTQAPSAGRAADRAACGRRSEQPGLSV
jgi:hypothetical protein